jgi:hypothetical protein
VKVVEKMDMIPQYTFAGDYTVEAIEKASQEVAKFDAGTHSAILGVGDQADTRSLSRRLVRDHGY